MLAAVLSLFMIFSFTGVAALNLSSFTAMETQDAVQNMKNQYTVESAINLSMWRINAGADSLVNYSDGVVTAALDTFTNELSVSIDRYEKLYQVTVDLSASSHFDVALAARDSILLNDNDLTADRGMHIFDFNLDVDLQYFYDNAYKVHGNDQKTFQNAQMHNGIHVFEGNDITLENLELASGTFVFLGTNISFDQDIYVNADTSMNLPAMIFLNPLENVSMAYNDAGDNFIVNGAIYAAGNIGLTDGQLTGPVMGSVISLNDDMTFTDNVNGNGNHYGWKNGFGNREDYDFDKQIGRWRVTYSD